MRLVERPPARNRRPKSSRRKLLCCDHTENRGCDEARRHNDLDRRIRQAIRVDAPGVEAEEAKRERGKTDYVGPHGASCENRFVSVITGPFWVEESGSAVDALASAKA